MFKFLFPSPMFSTFDHFFKQRSDFRYRVLQFGIYLFQTEEPFALALATKWWSGVWLCSVSPYWCRCARTCSMCHHPIYMLLLNWNTKICRWLVRNLWMLKGVLFSDWFNQPMCTTNTCRGKVLLQKTISALMGHQVPPCWSRVSKKRNHLLECRRTIAGCR